jgi:hypothetical protein
VKLRKNGYLKTLLAMSFPDYRGRTFNLEERVTLYFDPYGGGGTNSKFVLIDIPTGRSAAYRPTSPFSDKNAYHDVPLTDGTILVEHARSCGHDMGITFHVTPNTRLSLPFATVALPEGRT